MLAADVADSPQESSSAQELSASISTRMWYLKCISLHLSTKLHIGATDYLTIEDLYLVNVLMIDVAHLWKEVGLALHLKTPTLERIKNSGDTIRCFTEVLASWLNGEDRAHDSPAPNWGEAIAALNYVNERKRAIQLTQKLDRRLN